MKRLTLPFIVLFVLLIPTLSFAFGSIDFPSGPKEQMILEVGTSGIRIFAPGLPRPATGDEPFPHIRTGSPQDALEMAARNAWVAVLLQALATGNPVTVFYTTEDDEAPGLGSVPTGDSVGSILGISNITAQ